MYYRTGIIDAVGKIHKRVRTRELQALYERLVSERNLRERKVEGKWKLIQSDKEINELPIINETNHTSMRTHSKPQLKSRYRQTLI